MHLSSWRRVTTTALAGVTALALAAPPATAAEDAPDLFAGTADALTLDLTLTGPVVILGPLTDGSGTLRQVIATTAAELRSDGADAIVTRLGHGPLAPLSISETREREDRGRRELGAIDEGPLRAEGGVLEWAVESDALSWSRSELAMVTVSLAPVVAQLPDAAREPLQDAVHQATQTVNEVVADLNSALGQLEETLNEVDTQAPVDLPDVLPETLPVAPDVTSVDLLTIHKLWSDTRVETVDGLVRSSAYSGAAEMSLLGGVIRVPALQYVSTAAAGGEPGTASAETVVETIAVEIGDYAVGISGTVLTVGDVSIDLADPDLAGLPVDEQVEDIKMLLQDLIAAGGLSITQGAGDTQVDPAGTSASAATSAFALRLRPLQAAPAAADVVELSLLLMQTSAGVSAGQVLPSAPPVDEPALPRTGGGAAASLLGLLGIAGAVALQRRD